jgi:hypothetical protein
MQLTAGAIRKVADKIDGFYDYGMALFIWLGARSLGGSTFFAGRLSQHCPKNLLYQIS